ncbi:DUF488 domain-containing protein [Xanthobacter sp. TB0136]|uniref:DUF488 domain-containing protein n=1 Tax=Xanthobacter sp. TB0136 TaxID=3459177 RepID=UPI004039915B
MPDSLANLHVRRVYEPARPEDGARILVDRVWPRGLSKEKAALTLWLKEIAPSTELRKWFGHDPARYATFSERYRAELDGNEDALARLRAYLGKGPVTLLYGAHDEEHNQARVLADYLRRHGAP